MTHSEINFGFISVKDIEGVGHCGGLLLVSRIGRPIEFHCTAPVPGNRAQEILYGRTYKTFLYCEQIGLTLIQKAKASIHLLLSDCWDLSCLTAMQQVPTVVLDADRDTSLQAGKGSNEGPAPGESFSVRDKYLRWGGEKEELAKIRSMIEAFNESLPLDEPFERIHSAIEEAQTIAQ